VADESTVFLVCERVVTSNAQMVHKYRQGKKGLMGYFMAEVMKQTQGSADPRVATAILQRMLEEEQV
jgi:aspartyl-tRNA(Asn)/glutamyl-tRNA(Gln) amidotransferase subunit B